MQLVTKDQKYMEDLNSQFSIVKQTVHHTLWLLLKLLKSKKKL